MFSGRETLTSLYQTLQQAQQQVQEAERQIQTATGQLLQLDTEAAAHYRELARLRINLLAAGDIVQRLDAGERQVLELLQSRRRALQELETAIGESERQGRALEEQRARRSAAVDSALETLDRTEAATQQRLQQDPLYQEQLQRSQAAERVAGHAEEKTRQARQDRIRKGRPYEQDALFSYLWKRDYGTPEYAANPLTRALDGWVAGLIGFRQARTDYYRLLEIPDRLGEHAARVRAEADREFQALEALEQKAQAEDGIPALHTAVEQAKQGLQETLSGIESWRQSHQQLLDRKAAQLAGEDEPFQQMIALLAAEYRREEIRALRQDARLTPLPDDDRVVERLEGVEREQEQTRERMDELRRILKNHRQRVRDLESLIESFQRNRYDSADSSFKDGALLTMLLNEFLRGMLGRDGLWREIQRQQRTRTRHSNPDFGSNGFGHRRGTWGGGRRSRGGGFRSGGGVGGGGGFRTGGGF